LLFHSAGCSGKNPQAKAVHESSQDVEQAIKAIAEAVSGREVNEKELQELKHQLRHDEGARSAIQSMTNAMDQRPKRIKYSPLTGKRYAPHLEVDPETGAKLEWLEE
jgi:hypothetical protein